MKEFYLLTQNLDNSFFGINDSVLNYSNYFNEVDRYSLVL